MKFFTTFLLFIFVTSSFATAQKNSFSEGKEFGSGVVQSKAEYNQFMGNVKKMAKGDPEMAAMIPLINDVVLGNPIGTTGQKYKGTSSPLGLLENAKVREELDLVDDQFKELQTLSANIQKKAAEEMRSMDFSKVTNVATRIRSIQSKMQDDIEDLLLPHQVKRLRQLHTQSTLRRQSLARVLTSDPVKSDLNISEDQSEELLDAEKEIEAEIQDEIAKLRAKAREKLLSKLNSSQRKKADELFGDSFDFKENKKPNKKKSSARKTGKPAKIFNKD